MTTYDDLTALAPAAETLEPAWSEATLTRILADDPVTTRTPWWRTTRGRVAATITSGVLAVGAGAAVAGGGPTDVVKDVILDFSQQPNTTANGLGELDDPVQVAQFDLDGGVFAVWVATDSGGLVCSAYTDATWDGMGVPERGDLEYGCGGAVVDHRDPDRIVELRRLTQIGGFFKDEPDGPLVYGISPHPDTAIVRLEGVGVRRTLPVRFDSLGFGAALPGAARARALRLTWVDDAGHVLGSERWVAPVG